MSHQLRTTIDLPVPEAVDAVKAALKEQGFGVLTKIDMAARARRAGLAPRLSRTRARAVPRTGTSLA